MVLPSPWVTDSKTPSSMVIVGDYMYALSVSGGSIDKITLSTGVVEKNWVTGLSIPRGIAADATHLYCGSGNNKIIKIEIINTSNRVDIDSFNGNIQYFTLKGNYLYVPVANTGKVYRVAKSDGSKLEWVTGLSNPFGAAFVGSDLYISSTSGAIYKISSADGMTPPSSSSISEDYFNSTGMFGKNGQYNLGSDGTSLYAVENNDSKVNVAKINVIGKNIEKSLTGETHSPYGDIYVYNKTLYIAQEGRDGVTPASGQEAGVIYKIDITIQFTPLYLGKASISESGTMDFSNSLPTTNKVPTDAHQLVPKAYVDKYNADIVAYLTKVLDGNGLNDLLTRISDLEEQVNRSYKALWNVDRTEPVIRTAQNPGLVFNPEAHRRDTTGNNADMIANPPSAPSSLGSEFTA